MKFRRKTEVTSNVKRQTSNVVKAPRAFTLIEFLIYFGILSIVITAITSFMLTLSSSQAKTRAVAEVEQNMRLTVQRVLRATRKASSLNVGASTFNNDNGVLSLAMSATATDPTIFDLSGGVVRIKEGAGAATAITTSDVTITKLRFSNDTLAGGAKTVTVFIAADYNGTAGAGNYGYSGSASSTAVIRKQ